MRLKTVWKLLLKDWYLHRIAAGLTVVGSIAGVLLLSSSGAAPGIGASLAICVLISITFHLPLTSVVEERGEKTLSFLMSLPVSPPEYIASKILANVGLFLLPWLTIVIGVRIFADGVEALNTGFVPVVLGGMLLGFALVLGFSLITESTGWTVALIVSLLFLSSNVVTHLVPDTELVRRAVASIASRGAGLQVALALEAALILMVLGATFVIQSRKRDFL